MEVSDEDFSIIRSATAVTSNPRGIGGDADTIWYGDPVIGGGRVYHISTVDFSSLAFGSLTSLTGAGGDADVLWATKDTFPAPGKIYEVNKAALNTILRQANSPGRAFGDIGGTPDLIWHCDQFLGNVYELSSVDFSVIRSAASPYTTSAFGMGGNAGAIYHTKTGGAGEFAELSTVDFSLVRSALSGRNNRGIGGKR